MKRSAAGRKRSRARRRRDLCRATTLTGCMDGAEIATTIFAPRNVFAQMDGAEEGDKVVANGGIVGGIDVAEEIDNVVVGLAVQTHVPEEDNNVAVGLPSTWTLQKKQTASLTGASGVTSMLLKNWTASCSA